MTEDEKRMMETGFKPLKLKILKQKIKDRIKMSGCKNAHPSFLFLKDVKINEIFNHEREDKDSLLL